MAGFAAALAFVLAASSCLCAWVENAQAQDSAVVVFYNRLGGKGGPAHTDIDKFEAHIAHLVAGGYEVLPLPQLVTALRSGAAVPDHSVAITFDTGHSSVFYEAWPRLKAAGIPFTVFVATDPIDAGRADYLTWDQLRELASAGVTIGSHGAAYRHLAELPEAEAAAEIGRANQRFLDELGAAPELFAYPYGEYGTVLRGLIARQGLAAAFGQQSGVVYRGSDFLALPRYSLTGSFANLKRFRVVVDSLPLPVTDLVPPDPLLSTNPPPLGFTVAGDVGPLDSLACYSGRYGRLRIEQLGPSRIEVRFPDALPLGRNRVNCTLPGPEGRWRWFGLQFLVPAKN